MSHGTDNRYGEQESRKRETKWQSVKAGCCNLNIMVRKGFPEKVTFEQKPKVGEGVNHKGKVWP